MVVGFREDFVVFVRADEPPVDQKNMDVEVALDLADERFEVVAAVAVEDDDFLYAVMTQRNDNIPNHCIERRLRNMNRKRIGQLVAVDTEGKRRQTDDRLALGPGLLTALAGDMSCVEVVLSFGQMTVVSLDSPHRQDSDLIFALTDSIKIRRTNVPLIYYTFIRAHTVPSQKQSQETNNEIISAKTISGKSFVRAL